MKLPTIFISYNANEETEEVLAIRLHTIGAVHGFNMLLPDRFNSSKIISLETQNRIRTADYFIMFSTTTKLSTVVKQEIQEAYKKLNDKSKIIIIYDAEKGKTLKTQGNPLRYSSIQEINQ